VSGGTARLLGDGREEVGPANAFRLAQEEVSAGVSAKLNRNQLGLRLGVQVDQEIAATDEVHLGEGRVGDEVMGGKDDRLAERVVDLVALVLSDEEAQ
jgi:hypothetical protein